MLPLCLVRLHGRLFCAQVTIADGDLFRLKQSDGIAILPVSVDILIKTPDNKLASTISIHTSCSFGGVAVGDMLGSLKVVAIATTENERDTGCAKWAASKRNPDDAVATPFPSKKGKKHSSTHITSLTFRYLASHAQAFNNGLDASKWTFDSTGCLPGLASITTTLTDARHGVQTGGTFVVSAEDDDHAHDHHSNYPVYLTLYIANGNSEPSASCNVITIQTSCAAGGIAVGDVFGAVQVVAMSTSESDLATQCGRVMPSSDEDGVASSDRLPVPELGGTAELSTSPTPTFQVPKLQTIRLRFAGLEEGQVCNNRQGTLGTKWGFLNISLSVDADVARGAGLTYGSRGRRKDKTSLQKIRLLSSLTHYVVEADEQGEYTIEIPADAKDGSSAFFEIFDANHKIGECFFSTACGTNLAIGDQFGPLKVSDVSWEEDDCGKEPNTASMDVSSAPCMLHAVADTTLLVDPVTTVNTAVTTTVTATTATTMPTTHATTMPTAQATTPTTTTREIIAQRTIMTHVPTETYTRSMVEGAANKAYCRLDVHKQSAHDAGCITNKLDTVYLNASTGFTNQICTTHNTTASGSSTTLYMTIQPAECVLDGHTGPQKWRVCSWQPQRKICPDMSCCDPVDQSLPADTDPDVKELSCQVYEDGDCKQIIGFDGESVQIYTMELVRCEGEPPVDPGCQANKNARLAGKLLLAKDAPAQSQSSGTTAIGFLGLGMFIMSLAGYLRRVRLARARAADVYTEVKHAVEPDERVPLWRAELSCAALYDETKREATDPYFYAENLNGLLQDSPGSVIARPPRDYAGVDPSDSDTDGDDTGCGVVATEI